MLTRAAQCRRFVTPLIQRIKTGAAYRQPGMAELFKRAGRAWSAKGHWLFPAASRRVVFLVLLLAERLDHQAAAAAEVAADTGSRSEAQVSGEVVSHNSAMDGVDVAVLPPELWQTIILPMVVTWGVVVPLIDGKDASDRDSDDGGDAAAE